MSNEIEFIKGEKYNWKNQKERLIYLGKNWSGNGYWHQFALVESPHKVWCEVLDNQLSGFERTVDEATPPSPPPSVPDLGDNTDSKFNTHILNHGTFHDFELVLPKKGCWSDYLDAFIRSFIKYMRRGCLCSHTVLVSSIGASNMKNIMRQWVEFTVKDETHKKHVLHSIDDESAWARAVLSVMYEKDRRKGFEIWVNEYSDGSIPKEQMMACYDGFVAEMAKKHPDDNEDTQSDASAVIVE